jgi:uncharacterized membrane protein
VNRRLVVLVALVAASTVAIVLAMLRDAAAGNAGFWFLIWNLGLAWIPFLLALGAYAYARRATSMLALGLGWLLFFPNAPYIVTDFVHLGPGGPVPVWYDALTIGAFAAVGLALGFASLYLMQCVVRRELGLVASWLAVLAASALGSIGIYLGRFVRANSWDVLTRPEWVARLAHARLLDPLGNPRLIAVTFAFTLLLTVGYATLYRALAARVERET